MIILGLFAWLLALPFNQAFSFWQYILSNTCQISGVHPRRFTPDKVGPDAIHTLWKVNGVLIIRTCESNVHTPGGDK
jgi:hypothetical protein